MGAEVEHDRHFRTDDLERDLRGRSVRGGAVTMTAQGCRFVLGLASTAVLARLLTPEDFGLIAMVVAITGFVGQFKDLGLAMSTVQRAEINHRQVSTLFWVNVAFAFVITLITMALAPAVAWFYGEPRLIRVTVILACALIFGGLTVQHQALIRRKMRFTALAAVQVASVLAGIVVAIVSACLGAGYWALVVMQVVTAAAAMLGAWIMCDWRPGRPVRRSGVRSMLTFGGHLTGSTVLNYVDRNLDKVLIGWYWGAGPLGLYNKAYQLLMMPIQQVNAPLSSVAIPALSRLQDDHARYRLYYCRGVQLIALIGMPIVAFMFVSADKLILAFLGQQWIEAVPIFRLLGPAAFVGTFNVATGWVYISIGQTGRQLRWAIIGTVGMTLAFAVGLAWGALGVAAACSIATCCLRLPGILYCYQRAPLRLVDLLEALWRPALAAIGAGLALYGSQQLFLPDTHVVFGLLLDFVVSALSYALIWIVLPGGRSMMKEHLQLLKELGSSSKGVEEIANQTP